MVLGLKRVLRTGKGFTVDYITQNETHSARCHPGTVVEEFFYIVKTKRPL